MRDSVGGTFMIYVLLIFLAFFITFIAVALNYAKAFKVKNKVIDLIEQAEGFDKDDTAGVQSDIINYFKNIGYGVNNISYDKFCNGYDYAANGYCVKKVAPEIIDNNILSGISTSYYKVITFVKIDFPLLDQLFDDFGLNFVFPIKGETRKIERIID